MREGRSAEAGATGAGVRQLLTKHGLAARKSKGQHFLADGGVARRIVMALDPGPRDTVFEVGPGLGALTVPLASRVGRLVAIEVDRGFEPVLKERLRGQTHVEIRWEDARTVPWRQLALAARQERPERAVKLVGNLPYGLTGPLVGAILAAGEAFERIVIMVQREVAERMAASPGGKSYGYFSVFVQSHARVERLFGVSAGAFWPAPKVDSAVLRLWPQPWPGGGAARGRMLDVARAAFAQRRKTLANALAADGRITKPVAAARLAAAGVDPGRRAETLSLAEFDAIARGWPGRAASDSGAIL